ncbi:uncharacterized protein [Musca autumnalis]|uniref:uncharacterized protein n=1 Tax=Musca autumnalis TaxID=221902 RepID=UPI003CE7CCFF
METSDGDTTVVRLDEVTGRALVLASVYMPYEAPDPPSGLVRKLVEETTGRCRLVMGCDANAHHFHWGSRDTNARGESIFDFILANNLRVCNRGNTATFHNRVREEVIDLTLTNMEDTAIVDWRVSEECSFSDHRAIHFQVHHGSKRQPPHRNPRRTNWENYNSLVSSRLCEFPEPRTTEEIDGQVADLTRVLQGCYEKSCPLSYPGRRTQPVWWNNELAKLRKNSRKAFNKANSTKSDIDWNLYRESFNPWYN